MSAWLCSQHHIAILATALADLGHDAQATGETLLRENERSLRARYDERAESYFNEAGELTAPFVYDTRGFAVRGPGVAWLLKQVDCYAYQACEHAGWDASEAKQLCDEITAQIGGMSEDEAPALALDAIRSSREYNRAPWGTD
jgi:hypothetical protein